MTARHRKEPAVLRYGKPSDVGIDPLNALGFNTGMHNTRLLLPALLLILGCGGSHKQEIEVLKLEVQEDRRLLQETRAELQAIIEQLKPLLQIASLGSNTGLSEGPRSDTADTPEVDQRSTEEQEQQAKIDAGIRAVSDTEFEIKRGVVDLVLNNPIRSARGARVVPSVKGGKVTGFKLYAIRPFSIYAKLGFKNGDTLHSVNGHELSSPDKALDAYSKLKTATELTLRITRRGQNISIRYTIK